MIFFCQKLKLYLKLLLRQEYSNIFEIFLLNKDEDQFSSFCFLLLILFYEFKNKKIFILLTNKLGQVYFS
jgi:hypothetical protein